MTRTEGSKVFVGRVAAIEKAFQWTRIL